MHIITCEQVSNGHPDKICDQIADAIVTGGLAHDKEARVAAEVMIKGNQIIIAGEFKLRAGLQGTGQGGFRADWSGTCYCSHSLSQNCFARLT